MKHRNTMILKPELASLLERTGQILNQKIRDDFKDYNSNVVRDGVSLNLNNAFLKAADEKKIDLSWLELCIEAGFAKAQPKPQDSDCISEMIEGLEAFRGCRRQGSEVWYAYNAALDAMRVLESKLSQSEAGHIE